MLPNLHTLLGGAVVAVALIVGLWALVVARRRVPASRLLTAGLLLAMGLLLVQIVLGMSLWVQAGVPGVSLRGLVHGGGPVVALIVALGLVAGEAWGSAGRGAAAMLVIAALSLLSFAVRLLI